MIASEVPVLFSKACETFIAELTTRAWIIADASRRKTLSRSDVAAAISRSDMFDFLIDIVPREDSMLASGSGSNTLMGNVHRSGEEGIRGEDGASPRSHDDNVGLAQIHPSFGGVLQHSNRSRSELEEVQRRAAAEEAAAATGTSEELAIAGGSHGPSDALPWDDPSASFSYELSGTDSTSFTNLGSLSRTGHDQSDVNAVLLAAIQANHGPNSHISE